MKESIEFTDTERVLISYYRSPSLSSWSRAAAHDGIYLLISLGFIIAQLVKGDFAFGFAGYAILVWRIASGTWEARSWNPAMRGVFTKYEAKIAELTAELERQRGAQP